LTAGDINQSVDAEHPSPRLLVTQISLREIASMLVEPWWFRERKQEREKVTPMRASRTASKLAVAALAAGIVLIAAPAGACPPTGNTPTPTNQPQTQPQPQPPRVNVRDHRTPKPEPVVRDHRANAPVVRDHRAKPAKPEPVKGGGVTVVSGPPRKPVIPQPGYNPVPSGR
jgi:hypothetical protein